MIYLRWPIATSWSGASSGCHPTNGQSSSCITTRAMHQRRSPRSLGILPGTARSRLHHAHRAMRAALDADARLATAGGQSA